MKAREKNEHKHPPSQSGKTGRAGLIKTTMKNSTEPPQERRKRVITDFPLVLANRAWREAWARLIEFDTATATKRKALELIESQALEKYKELLAEEMAVHNPN